MELTCKDGKRRVFRPVSSVNAECLKCGVLINFNFDEMAKVLKSHRCDDQVFDPGIEELANKYKEFFMELKKRERTSC